MRCLPLLLLGFLVFRLGAVSGAEWRSLFDGQSLKGWRRTEFGGSGEVEVLEGSLVLNQGALTGVNFEGKIPQIDYEVELEAKRVLGTDFFCGLTFPVNDAFCTLIMGGWGGAVVGLSSIDGDDAAHNETTRYIRFTQDRWYRIRLRVTSEAITAWLDDDRIIEAGIRGRTISLRPGEIELSKPFGIATWSTLAHLRNIRLRELDAAGSGGALATQEACRRLALAATNGLPAWKRLAQLCDTFGPRFSGSTNLEAAIDWTLGRMRADGLENVRGEPVTVPVWRRGREEARLLEPRVETLPMLGLGGSVGTPPEGLSAEVLVVRSFDELRQRADEARGRIVVFAPAYTEYNDTVRFRVHGAVEASRAGAIASLTRSVTPFSLRTPHTGAMSYDRSTKPIPHGALAAEDVERMVRWQEAGQRIRLQLRMEARTEPDGQSRNIVAEVRGREWPDEIVVVGGHFDSWDVGQGAQDDGGGCVSAWEALRLMKELGLRPRRTVRCVLWTNEENGLRGARAYRELHAGALGRHVAAIEADNGTFLPQGFAFTGSDAGLARVQEVGRWLNDWLRAGSITRGVANADVGVLLEAGVPVLGLKVDRTRYFWFHHSDADTVDKVDPRDLGLCTASMAVMAYAIADAPERLPR